ncbi:MAG: hypothetical protein RRY97_04600, partial [Oscillibacter sp.]
DTEIIPGDGRASGAALTIPAESSSGTLEGALLHEETAPTDPPPTPPTPEEQLAAMKVQLAALETQLQEAIAQRDGLQAKLEALSPKDSAGNPIPFSTYLLSSSAQLKAGWSQYQSG